jgi:hypothetical protein
MRGMMSGRHARVNRSNLPAFWPSWRGPGRNRQPVPLGLKADAGIVPIVSTCLIAPDGADPASGRQSRRSQRAHRSKQPPVEICHSHGPTPDVQLCDNGVTLAQPTNLASNDSSFARPGSSGFAAKAFVTGQGVGPPRDKRPAPAAFCEGSEASLWHS